MTAGTAPAAAPLRVLFASPEAGPYWKTGGLADVARSLPDALVERGHDVRIILPFYGAIRDRGLELREAGRLELPWTGGTRPVRFLEHRPASGAPAILVDEPASFDVEEPYVAASEDPLAPGRRFALFCRAVLRYAAAWNADVIHLNDWQTGLVPAYALVEDVSIPTVFAIHNLAYQGNFPAYILGEIGLPFALHRTENGLEFFGQVSFLKGGLALADRLITVSPNYAREIQTREFGAGFDGLLRIRRRLLNGILNGIDPGSWNPARDPALPAPYDARDLTGKDACRRALAAELGLEPRAPIFAMVTRLAHQKGIDLLLEALPALRRRGFRLAVLGDGGPEYERALRRAARQEPRRIAAVFRFDDGLARRIYAGADFFLMPSVFEPCGLGQLIAQRYGTPPVARRTGGLADTVEDGASGFTFDDLSASSLLAAIERGRAAWRGPGWDALRRRCMRLDRSWARSAAAYEAVYRTAIGPVLP